MTTASDIAVLKTELNHVRELVERNHRDAVLAQAETKASLEALKIDLNERKGAEKLATAIRMTFAGTIGALVVKGISWLGALPK